MWVGESVEVSECNRGALLVMRPNQPTVFVVDDDPSVRKALTRMLGAFGYCVESFESADEFLQRNPRDEEGCLILDVQMPGLDGLGLQAELDRRDLGIPIVFLTAHGDIPLSVRAMKAGRRQLCDQAF